MQPLGQLPLLYRGVDPQGRVGSEVSKNQDRECFDITLPGGARVPLSVA
jgi:hypothetical protein